MPPLDPDQWVVHVDLDQFIAAVEVQRDPTLAGRPVVVGGDGDPAKRGVVATASYEARAFGVRSGMPMRVAARRCPDAVFLPSDREAYEAASARVVEVLRSFDVVVEVLGWDEAFLGVRSDDPQALAQRVRAAVLERTGLASCAGVGRNRLQAKTATGFAKPTGPAAPGPGVFTITGATWADLMGDRPTDALWGIGSRTRDRLAGLGVRTVADLAAADPQALAGVFGPTTGPWLVRLGRGVDTARVDGTPWVARSRSRETTYQEDLSDWDDVRAAVDVLASRVAADVAAEGRPVARVVVKVRYAPFFTSSHGRGLASPTTDAGDLARAAQEALAAFEERRPVRLLGVRAEFAALSSDQ